MLFYNRFQHCKHTFYTGTSIDKIECGDCGEELTEHTKVKTEEPISKQDGDISAKEV